MHKWPHFIMPCFQMCIKVLKLIQVNLLIHVTDSASMRTVVVFGDEWSYSVVCRNLSD
jgi:hypothetical protein